MVSLFGRLPSGRPDSETDIIIGRGDDG